MIHLAAQLAEALAHAHARGIFHRDIKPSNILMSPEGRPLLLDFNLSVDERRPNRRIGGTLPYMAPEELSTVYDLPDGARSPGYDPRSDLFSLGVVVYELLTGELPFGDFPWQLPMEEIAAELWQRQAQGPRPIRERNPQVDQRLAGLIDRCLAFDPENRPAKADELAAALRKELTLPRRTTRWATAHRRPVFSAALAATLAVLGTAAFLVLRPPYSARQLQQGLAYYAAGQDDPALDCLNTALRIEPHSRGAIVARARVFQRMGDFRLAFADYEAVDRLAPSATIAACLGYCLSRLAQDEQAAAYYRRSLRCGDDSPAVLNNLGYCGFQLHQLDEAEAYLRRAAQADDTLQAVHHNLVLVFLERGCEGQVIPPEAFVHARRALEIGPQTGDLYRDLAILYAVAAKRDAALAQAAIGHVARSVALGMNAEFFRSDSAFAALRTEHAFQEAIVTPVERKTTAADLLIDPSGEVQ